MKIFNRVFGLNFMRKNERWPKTKQGDWWIENYQKEGNFRDQGRFGKHQLDSIISKTVFWKMGLKAQRFIRNLLKNSFLVSMGNNMLTVEREKKQARGHRMVTKDHQVNIFSKNL